MAGKERGDEIQKVEVRDLVNVRTVDSLLLACSSVAFWILEEGR